MDLAALMGEAREAGLELLLDPGGTLRIRGPRRAEPVALRLLQYKNELAAELRRNGTTATPTPARPPAATASNPTARPAATGTASTSTPTTSPAIASNPAAASSPSTTAATGQPPEDPYHVWRREHGKPTASNPPARLATPPAAAPEPSRPRVPDGFIERPLAWGDLPAGWTPATWARELRRKAGTCREQRPDISEWYSTWAAYIERRLQPQPATHQEHTENAANR